MQFTADSHALQEFNRCHSPQDGRFCSGVGGTTRVGITSARGIEDIPYHRTNRQVFQEMHVVAQALRKLPGVSGVSVNPALGGWVGGSEPSWAVQYIGNGEAKTLMAQVGERWNQDAVLLTHSCRGSNCERMREYSFDGPISLKQRLRLSKTFGKLGMGGWTWLKRNGRTTLRLIEVPDFGTSPEQFTKVLSRMDRLLARLKVTPRVRTKRVRSEALWNDGAGRKWGHGLTYREAMRRVAA